MLKSNLSDYGDAYILVRGNITIIEVPATHIFKNSVPFTKCITKIDGTTIDDIEDLDLVMPMYNLIEYSSNYSETTGSLWFYSKDEATNFKDEILKTLMIFKNKTKLLGNTVDQPLPNQTNGIIKKQLQCHQNI